MVVMAGDILDIDNRTVAVTNLGKVLYPAGGIRKYDVIDYYNRHRRRPAAACAGASSPQTLAPAACSRPRSSKHLPEGAPAWLPRYSVEHGQRSITYAMADNRAALVEAGADGHARAASRSGESLSARNRSPRHVSSSTSRTRGPANRMRAGRAADQDMSTPRACAFVSGDQRRQRHPRTPSSTARCPPVRRAPWLNRSRPGWLPPIRTDHRVDSRNQCANDRVFIDWSQNSASKTTLAYSLRGRERPWAAAPRVGRVDRDLRRLLYPGGSGAGRRSPRDLLAGLDNPLSSHGNVADLSGSTAANATDERRNRSATTTAAGPRAVPIS